MYTSKMRTKENDIDVTGKATNPYPPFAGTSSLYCIFFLENVFGLYFCHFDKVIPMQLPIKGGLYKASDLLHGDHVCEKSDAVKWIDCP